ncbi:unnamed protein product [Dovyalis caffra]|uniref:Uncharacterized protein n=1 Tax=Dovyalis caffra TaxID=77055 RepID=A0AAV1R4Q5_9ROSI|nr:unnamed protein product [Dovyalis caffra]
MEIYYSFKVATFISDRNLQTLKRVQKLSRPQLHIRPHHQLDSFPLGPTTHTLGDYLFNKEAGRDMGAQTKPKGKSKKACAKTQRAASSSPSFTEAQTQFSNPCPSKYPINRPNPQDLNYES